MRKSIRFSILAAAVILCGLALTGCPDNDGGSSWSFVVHGDANPGNGVPGGFTGHFEWHF